MCDTSLHNYMWFQVLFVYTYYHTYLCYHTLYALVLVSLWMVVMLTIFICYTEQVNCKKRKKFQSCKNIVCWNLQNFNYANYHFTGSYSMSVFKTCVKTISVLFNKLALIKKHVH